MFSAETLSLRTKLNTNRKIDRTENKGHVQPNASKLFLARALSLSLAQSLVLVELRRNHSEKEIVYFRRMKLT